MSYQIHFYEDSHGSCPVEEFLATLPAKHRAKALRSIDLLEEFGWNLGMPHVRMIKGTRYKGLFEIRIKFASDISRILYFSQEKDSFILLHGFTKKTEKTPQLELECAYKRMLICAEGSD